MRKLRSLCSVCLAVLLIPSMLWVTILLVSQISFPVFILSALGLLALFCLRRNQNFLQKFFTKQRCRLIAFTLLGLLLFVQIFLAVQQPVLYPKGDYDAVFFGAAEIASLGKLTDSLLYFQLYPHQLFSTFCYGVINRIFLILGSSSAINVIATSLVNCVLTTASGIILYFSSERLWTSRIALLITLLFCCNVTYWTHNIHIYPHVFSCIFLSGSLYIASRAFEHNSSALWFIGLGFILSIARSCEGILLIGFIAALITVVVTAKRWKRCVVQLAALVCGFVVASALVQFTYTHFQIGINFDTEDIRFPYTHWIMMGISEGDAGAGTFSQKDYDAVVSLHTTEEKTQYTVQQIIERFGNYSPREFLSHLAEKEHRAWIGSAYGATIFTRQIDGYLANAWRVVCTIGILLFACSLFRHCAIQRQTASAWSIFTGTWIMGLFLFLLLWESAYNYLHSSQLILLYTAVQGFFPELLHFESNKETLE